MKRGLSPLFVLARKHWVDVFDELVETGQLMFLEKRVSLPN
jgi:hypothetical protein